MRSNQLLERKSHRLESSKRHLLTVLIISLVGTGCVTQKTIWSPPPVSIKKLASGLSESEAVAFFPQDDLYPKASLDGRFVFFVSGETGNLDVWVRDYRTDSTFPITSHPADDYDPTISNDGKSIAIVSRRADAKGDIFIANISELKFERMTDDKTQERQPVFSRDGQSIFATVSDPAGLEYIGQISAKKKTRVQRVSPTQGFDPTVHPELDIIIYTAPAGVSGRKYPHLVALRLIDSATVALTKDDAPSGFASIAPTQGLASTQINFVRFPDDDNGDGLLDGKDSASIWSIQVDFNELFESPQTIAVPIARTDGTGDSLFPSTTKDWLYYTVTVGKQQDIVRLPAKGLFPQYSNLEDYFRLAELIESDRERWFVFRQVVARTSPDSLLHAQALKYISELQFERGRFDLAKTAWERLLDATRHASLNSKRSELNAIARIELAGLARIADQRRDLNFLDNEQSKRRVRSILENIRVSHSWSKEVTARIDIENAELLLTLGNRAEAIRQLDDLIDNTKGVDSIVIRAMIRRAEIFESVGDPEALTRIYSDIIRKFPRQTRWVNNAAARIVEAHRISAMQVGGVNEGFEAIRRLISRSELSQVRVAGRNMMSKMFLERGEVAYAITELNALVDEAIAANYLAIGFNGFRKLAHLYESRGELAASLNTWQRAEKVCAQLPQVVALARSSRTRLNLKKAQEEENSGRTASAFASYQAVIDEDFSQVSALRRYIALGAELEKSQIVLSKFKKLASAAPRSPIARYSHALALTWMTPPRLNEAMAEVEQVISLNPQFRFAYMTRGWIYEMLELKNPASDFLERAIADYTVANRLNNDVGDLRTEGEINLNLANARFRLGVRANDIGNIDIAFRLYLERVRAKQAFRSSSSEIVFWERLGRAAAWKKEWAISIMATKRALVLAESNRSLGRKSQLLGNLALAYSQSGEAGLAQQAFEDFQSEIVQKDTASCEGIALRNAAIEIIKVARQFGHRDVRQAIIALEESRSALDDGRFCQVKVPTFINGPLNSSRAPYGFSADAELGLNLAWTQSAFELLGDSEAVELVQKTRRDVIAQQLDSPQVMTVSLIQEQLALEGLAFRRTCRLEGLEECLQQGRNLLELLSKGAVASDFSIDSVVDRSLLYTRATLIALLAEEFSAASDTDSAEETAFRAKLRGIVRSTYVKLETLLKSFSELNSSEAPERKRMMLRHLRNEYDGDNNSRNETTDSQGISIFELERALTVFARFNYSRALLKLYDAKKLASSLSVQQITQFDFSSADVELSLANEYLRRAYKWSSLGVSKLALNLKERVRLTLESEMLELVGTSTTEAGVSERKLFNDLRRLDNPALTLKFFDSKDNEELDQLFAAQLVRNIKVPWYKIHEKLFSQTLQPSWTSSASDDLLGLLRSIDRSLILKATLGRGLARNKSMRPEVSAQLRDIYRTESELKDWYANSDDGIPDAYFLDQLTDRTQAHREAISDISNIGLAVRSKAYVFDPIEIYKSLQKNEIMIVPFPLGEKLAVLTVTGSSTVSNKAFRVRTTEVPFRLAITSVREIISSLTTGEVPEREHIWDWILAGVVESASPINTLVLCGSYLGAPVPRIAHPVLDKFSLVHSASPTIFALGRQSEDVSASGLARFARNVEGNEKKTSIILETKRLDVSSSDTKDTRPYDGRDDPKIVVVFEDQIEINSRDLENTVMYRSRDSELLNKFGIARDLANITSTQGKTYLSEVMAPAHVWVFQDAKVSLESGALGLELETALMNVPGVVIVPSTIDEEVRTRLVSNFISGLDKHGAAEALKQAILVERDEYPAVGLVYFVGSPTQNKRTRIRSAKKKIRRVERLAVKAIRKQRISDVIRHLESLRRLQKVSRSNGRLKRTRTYEFLVQYLRSAQALPRATIIQDEYIAFLKNSNRKGDAARQSVVRAEILSQTGKNVEAEAAFLGAIKQLEERSDEIGLAQAHSSLGMHYRRSLAFKKAAGAFERAARIHSKQSLIRSSDKRQVKLALDNFKRLGAVYTNQLADSKGAKSVYERWLSQVSSASERIEPMLGLARVARREGDFETALSIAEKTQILAQQTGDKVRELEAVVEGANVAWYQGDYVIGQKLCSQSLSIADENISAERKKKNPRMSRHIKGKIYSLSVCGLLNMSTNNFLGARRDLVQAADLARSAGLQTELATQYNNLGRAYLEFGLAKEAIKTFRKALVIDQRLADKFGLAYDLRNLGAGLGKINDGNAEKTLVNALSLAREVQDKNNEMRTLFELGRLYFRKKIYSSARSSLKSALKLADERRAQDLRWKIHRLLGLIDYQDGNRIGAEEELLLAVEIVRSMALRSGSSEFGVSPYTVFDDMMILLVEEDRLEEAYEFLEEGRVLSQFDLLADARIQFRNQELSSTLRKIKATKSSSVASIGREKIKRIAPRLSMLLEKGNPERIADALEKGQAIVSYRLTYRGLLIFVLDDEGVQSEFVPLEGAYARALIRDFGRKMLDVAEVSDVVAELSTLLIKPIEKYLQGKERIAFVVSGLLRYVSFAALDFGEEKIIDKFLSFQTLAPATAFSSDIFDETRTSEMKVVTFEGPDTEENLPFASKEKSLISEALLGSRFRVSSLTNKEDFVNSLANKRAIIHYAGHFELNDRDSLASVIRFETDQISLYELFSFPMNATLVAFSACQSRVGAKSLSPSDKPTGKEMFSMTESILMGGAKSVLSSISRVDDVASAVLMKRFYRELRKHSPAVALRKASQIVRKYHPHPSWWANFVLVNGLSAEERIAAK